MASGKKNFFKFIAMFMQKKYSLLFFPMIFLFTVTVAVYPEEVVIPGDKKLEKELHLYVTAGYQEMADGELIYFWGYIHAKDFSDVGEIKTKEERNTKLLPIKVPGDEIRLTSGKNYVIVLHNAGWYETEKHSGVNHV